MKTNFKPSVEIDITGCDGNAYCIIGHVMNVLNAEHYTIEEIETVVNDMTSSTYEHLCDIAEKYIILKNRKNIKL
jgi:hypothetical protein